MITKANPSQTCHSNKLVVLYQYINNIFKAKLIGVVIWINSFISSLSPKVFEHHMFEAKENIPKTINAMIKNTIRLRIVLKNM